MSNTLENKRGKFYGWNNVVLLFLVYSAVMGFLFYGFTVIFPAMITAQGWGRGEASFAHTIRGFIVGFIAPLVAYSIGKIGNKKTILVGLSFGVVTLFLLGTVVDQLWQWTLIWGFMIPITYAFSGGLSVQTTVTFWFNKKRATALGIVLSGGAVAGFVAAPFFTFLMQKAGTWRVGWLAVSGILLMALIVSLFIKNKPSDLGQVPDGIAPEVAAKAASQTVQKKSKTPIYQTHEVWTVKEAWKTPFLYLLMICRFGQGWALSLVTVHGVLHLIGSGLSKMEAASVISTLVLFSGISRFPMGMLGDRISPRVLTAIALAGMTLTMVGLWIAPKNLPLLLTIAGAYGLFFGATVILMPALIGNYFGPAGFAPINGSMGPITTFITAPFPMVAGYLFDHYKSYDYVFMGVVAFMTVSTLCAALMVPPKKKAATA
ncbi:MAG: MFS transporter [Desulfobacteraceae bacterium]|nr:MFS transporter [Desulfobacteraceae bacterium]